MQSLPSKHNKFVWRLLKVLWLIACISILVLTLIYRGPEYRDALEAEVIIMIALSYPSGWLFAYLFLGTLIGGSKTTELQWIFLVWVPLVVLGYLQWFVLLPIIVRWFRRTLGRRKDGEHSSIIPKG